MKTYYSTLRRYMTFIHINGKSVKIEFQDLGQLLGKGWFATDNKSIIDALESHKDFNHIFYLEKVEGEEEHKEAEEKIEKVYEEVRRTQEANKILVSEYGIAKERLNSKDDAKRIAEELHISFPNL